MILCTVEQSNVEFKLFRNQTGRDSSGESRGWVGARDARTPGVQILSISCSFWENLAKSYVGVPSLWRVGAPTSGESWIRHWIGQYKIDQIPSKRSLQM